VLLSQRVLDRVEEAIYNAGTVFLADHRTGRPRDLCGHLLDQVGLGHRALRVHLSARDERTEGRIWELTY